ncbi:TonB-dependent receptor plug domain-containing protein [Chitinophaga sedimenti]|uniref:T9SS type A sorting domain-containing protein n=1 Tax=Chitinophaga sedimenti TaxID=2033606 RepID=UPI00200660B3|nr:T9SS type A sorting domain-containing protein [Chitinophaga sedimenti]MCK7560075.1 TonB-dependent receptor plug domain-containing protein [Chitinophaga sedimenti]
MLIDGKPDSTISHLNSDQIESVTVLKDQAALAIYGSRAANGVILVQTKKGKTVKDTVVTNLIRRVQDPSLEEIVVTGMASPAPRTETIAIREKAKAETAAHQKLFRVFPNPSSTGSFNAQFQLAGDGKYEARLYNSKGVEVSRMAGDGTPGSFKTLDFVVTGAPGVYYLHVFTGGHRAAKSSLNNKFLYSRRYKKGRKHPLPSLIFLYPSHNGNQGFPGPIPARFSFLPIHGNLCNIHRCT